ncbi:hypothetical protein D9619_001978 [Psilocybe cf. subviscida]|uniref:DUF221-domain-containing protein n=1 Tax=Psilocybe cf. subviscida TaxID=2480587 RepID=A0A8H5BF40_9AGAR|nr:hypothetical protein D9619_001978 [Psilocybe cf. subviscida]
MALYGFQRRIDAKGIQQLLNTTNNTEPKAVIIQVGIMTVLSLLTLLIFNILRPNRQHVYEPKVKYHTPEKAPPHASRSFCGWLTPLMHNHESQLLSKIGLDAVAFLRFLDLMKVLLGLTALVTCGALIPIDLLYTLQTNPPQHDILTAMTIRDVHGVRLWAHIGAVYLITLFLLVLVHHHWHDMYALRDQWFRSDEYQHALHARSVIVMHIPERRRSEQGIFRIFEGMQLPYTVTSAYIGRDAGSLPDLVDIHDETVEELEKVLTKHSRAEDSTKRPTVKIGGCCGLGGRRRDAIKYYITKLNNLSASIDQYRAQASARHPENFGFVTLDSVHAAHAAAYDLKGEHPKGLTIKLAPNHKDIIWKNIGLSKKERRFKRITGFILLSLFCLLSLVPLFPIASLANLSAVAASGYVPFLSNWAAASPISYVIASGIVPPAVAAIFGYFLPGIMRWLSKYMGAPTHSSLDRVVIARYFTFLFVSQLIFFTVIGVLFQSILNIIIVTQNQRAGLKGVFDNLKSESPAFLHWTPDIFRELIRIPKELPKQLASTYVDQSSFWLKWFPLRGFLLIFDLSQVSTLLWLSWSRRAFKATPRILRESSKPPYFPYATQYSGLLFMGVTGILFAPLAPLVSLAAAIIFWLSSWVYKYQLVYKFVTRVESGGRAWNVVINRLMFGCIFMQLIMIFTIGLQSEFKSFQFLATLPPILLTILFKYYINRRFANNFEYFLPSGTTEHYYSSRRAVDQSQSQASRAADEGKLDGRYQNPALSCELSDPLIGARAASALRGMYNMNQDLWRTGSVRFRGVSGKARDKDVIVSARADANDTVVEGVTFKAVPEDDFECDPDEYRRERAIVERDFDPVEQWPPQRISLKRNYSDKVLPDPPRTNANSTRINLYKPPSYIQEVRRSQMPDLSPSPTYVSAKSQSPRDPVASSSQTDRTRRPSRS